MPSSVSEALLDSRVKFRYVTIGVRFYGLRLRVRSSKSKDRNSRLLLRYCRKNLHCYQQNYLFPYGQAKG